MKPLMIGIAGGSGSGKTTFANRIAKEFTNEVTLLCHDYYYSAFNSMPLEERMQQNFDHPASFDTDLLIQDMQALNKNKPIQRPVYSYTEFTRLPETVTVLPTKIILLEGILILENAELRDLLDIKIFVDADADIRFIRRLQRDVKKRGRSMESVIEQYLKTVKPMHDQFIEPSRRYADVIIPQGGKNRVAFEMVAERIRKELQS